MVIVAVSLLNTLPLPRTGEYIFPARTELAAHSNGWWKCKERSDRELEAVAHYTLHDLRRTLSSNLAMLRTPIHVTEKFLNHKSGTISGVAAVYNRHSYMDEMRAAVAVYDLYLSESG